MVQKSSGIFWKSSQGPWGPFPQRQVGIRYISGSAIRLGVGALGKVH